MTFNHLIEPNRVLKKFVNEPILAWTEIDTSKLHYKRSWYSFFLNLLPLPVRFTQQNTVSVLVLTDNHLHKLNLGVDNNLYKSSKVYNRSSIEECEIVKQKNEWQKDVVIKYEGEDEKITIHNYPSLFKHNFGLLPDDAEAEDFIEMSNYLLNEL